MSKLIFNGHSYTGGSVNPNLATDVVYDNTTSGLDADNVQEAVDEIAPVKSSIGNIDNVTLSTSDNNKLLGVSVSGSDISVSAVEIPNLNNIAFQTATRNDAGGFTGGQCRYIKCGKLVIGVIEDLIGVNSTHNAVVFSNLPIPATGMIGLIQLTGGAFKAPFRVRITNGNIVNWYSSISNVQGSEGYMTFVYVSQ